MAHSPVYVHGWGHVDGRVFRQGSALRSLEDHTGPRVHGWLHSSLAYEPKVREHGPLHHSGWWGIAPASYTHLTLPKNLRVLTQLRHPRAITI